MKIHKNAAIELSANFIVIIVISIVILSSGLIMFFKLKDNAVKYYEGVDSRTQEQLKAVMLNNNYRIAVFPSDLELASKKSATFGVGITNIANYEQKFSARLNYEVWWYKTPESNGVNQTATWRSNNALKWGPSTTINDWFVIKPKDQYYKNMLLIVPKGTASGLYVLKITIDNTTTVNCPTGGCPIPYGIVKVYVTVP